MSVTARSTIYEQLLTFLERIDHHHVPYGLTSIRAETIMAQFALPGERWEVEFMAGGDVEVECFRSDGQIGDESALDALWQRMASDSDQGVSEGRP